jgi:hypothetical protein
VLSTFFCNSVAVSARIGTTSEQQTIHLVQRNVAFARVENMNVKVLHEIWLKPFFILRT